MQRLISIPIVRARFLQKRVRNPEFDEELARIVADTEPVECHAPAGSVIFWHARLVHSAGRNSGTGVRSGVIYEYYKKEDPTMDNSLFAEVERGNLPDMWYVLSPSYCSCDLVQIFKCLSRTPLLPSVFLRLSGAVLYCVAS